MKTLTKLYLVLTLIGFTLGLLFVTGVIAVGDAVGWYMTLPVGAICFGLFLVTFMLEKEMAGFDAEQKLHQTDTRRLESNTAAGAAACGNRNQPATAH